MSRDQIITGESLTQFFYKSLMEVNTKSLYPISQELILYSSEVLNFYAFSENFYKSENGKTYEKILGMKFFEAKNKSTSEKKTIYKDVGDTILVQLGLFSKRLNRKSASKKYYLDLGRSSYSQLEKLNCTFYDIPHFYNLLSVSFEYIVKLLALFDTICSAESLERYLLSSTDEKKRSLLSG